LLPALFFLENIERKALITLWITFSKEYRHTPHNIKTENEKSSEIIFPLIKSTPELSSRDIVNIVENINVKNLTITRLIFALSMTLLLKNLLHLSKT
jgi:hypothetical protein